MANEIWRARWYSVHLKSGSQVHSGQSVRSEAQELAIGIADNLNKRAHDAKLKLHFVAVSDLVLNLEEIEAIKVQWYDAPKLEDRRSERGRK